MPTLDLLLKKKPIIVAKPNTRDQARAMVHVHARSIDRQRQALARPVSIAYWADALCKTFMLN